MSPATPAPPTPPSSLSPRLFKLASAHILRLLSCHRDDTSDWGVFEWCGGGDLFEKTRRAREQGVGSNGYLPMAMVKRCFAQMVHALYVLHEGFNIAHRDFSLENLLLDHDHDHDDQVVKLADFGLAEPVSPDPKLQWYNTGTKRKIRVGKLGYLAPEAVAQRPYLGKNADMFALGVCLFQLLAAMRPFRVANRQDKGWMCIEAGRLDRLVTRYSLGRRVTPLALDLLNTLFRGHDARSSIKKVMDHPFYRSCLLELENKK